MKGWGLRIRQDEEGWWIVFKSIPVVRGSVRADALFQTINSCHGKRRTMFFCLGQQVFDRNSQGSWFSLIKQSTPAASDEASQGVGLLLLVLEVSPGGLDLGRPPAHPSRLQLLTGPTGFGACSSCVSLKF